MQLFPLGQPDKVTRIDRNQCSAFVHSATPDYVIRLPDEAAITQVVNIVPSLDERRKRCWRHILVENQSQACATYDLGRPTRGWASV
jgi:hypothetical protein